MQLTDLLGLLGGGTDFGNRNCKQNRHVEGDKQQHNQKGKLLLVGNDGRLIKNHREKAIGGNY